MKSPGGCWASHVLHLFSQNDKNMSASIFLDTYTFFQVMWKYDFIIWTLLRAETSSENGGKIS